VTKAIPKVSSIIGIIEKFPSKSGIGTLKYPLIILNYRIKMNRSEFLGLKRGQDNLNIILYDHPSLGFGVWGLGFGVGSR
jgi:hypothetical protein